MEIKKVYKFLKELNTGSLILSLKYLKEELKDLI